MSGPCNFTTKPINQCTDNLGDYYNFNGAYCNNNDIEVNNFCSDVNDNEWKIIGVSNCEINNCSNGKVPACQRSAFVADPAICCAQNYKNNQENTAEFKKFKASPSLLAQVIKKG